MSTSAKQIVVALAGNPNSGKSSLFNKLTGLRAHVGNYPGVTVEQKWGQVEHRGRSIKFVDLPGSYSLTSYSLEERVARDFFLNERPDVVVDVADATNLERNLYLTLQFLELGIPTVVALNMMDMARAMGLLINTAEMGRSLGAPVTPVVATTGEGLPALLDCIIETAERAPDSWRALDISYGPDIDEVLGRLITALETNESLAGLAPPRWLAVKYLENDSKVRELVARKAPELDPAFSESQVKLAAHLRATADNEIEGALADHRYGFLSGLGKKVLKKTRADSRSRTDTIDSVLLNRLLAPIFFLAVIYGLYEFTFWASEPLVGWLETFFGWAGETVEAHMADGLLKDLILEGLIGGVGGVMGFVPLIAFMFIGISVLEDTGYMARVAFILDRLFRAFGLHGNSVVALIVGGGIAGGCAIPGVMAARTLRDPKERIATILVTPFMTCGAKLPVFLMLVSAFFSEHQGLVMFGLTIFAWAVALISAKLLRTFILKGEPAPFVLELPPYRLPTLRGIFLHAWERTWSYIKRAGTIIVGVAIIIWLMMTYPGLPADQEESFGAQIAQLEEALADEPERAGELSEALGEAQGRMNAARLENSLAGRIGRTLETLSRPVGFDWRTNIALVGGFAAKEVVLSTLGTAWAMAESVEIKIENDPAGESSHEGEVPPETEEEEALIMGLSQTLKNDPAWTPLTAVSLMIFVLIYAPCFVTITVIKKEIGLKWAVFSLAASTAYAYLICLTVFQGGRLLGVGL